MIVNRISGSGIPPADSSREQELANKLSERLANRLSDIRQRIAPPEETISEPGVGRMLDVRA